MNRIVNAFNKAKYDNRICFIPFCEFGYPSLERFSEIVDIICRYGDIVEIGIPFSDPIADGPIIQKASDIAIRNGANLSKAFEWLYKFRKNDDFTPIVFMLYYNLVHYIGVKEFFRIAKDIGLDGVIIPDLPIEESDNVYPYRDSVSIIWLASVTTSDVRLKKIVEKSDSFIYCVSVKGVTGPRDEVSKDGLDLIRRIKNISHIPTALGFGLKSKEQIRSLVGIVDGVIVGSEIIRIIEDSSDSELEIYLKELKSATSML
ncbi:MAG: tryptophan synthase subunit alpha [bacterium]|nr:tryptophan synthase subunit alpha [bacterium]